MPIILLSCFSNPCNHSRTGSRPASVRKKTAGRGSPVPKCIIFDTLSKQDLHLERWFKDLCEMLTRAREFRDIGGYVAWPRDSLPFRWRNCAGQLGRARDARGSRASCSPKGREKRR